MQETTLKLVYEFTCQVVCGAPLDAGAGPYGNRQYYEIKGGTVKGLRLRGTLAGSGGDWMINGPDGFMRMDVRIQIKTEDGAIIGAHYFGPAEANEKLIQAVNDCAPTEFANQSIRSHWVLETGDPRYLWVNQTVFASQGRLLPAHDGSLGFEHEVFRMG